MGDLIPCLDTAIGPHRRSLPFNPGLTIDPLDSKGPKCTCAQDSCTHWNLRGRICGWFPRKKCGSHRCRPRHRPDLRELISARRTGCLAGILAVLFPPAFVTL